MAPQVPKLDLDYNNTQRKYISFFSQEKQTFSSLLKLSSIENLYVDHEILLAFTSISQNLEKYKGIHTLMTL